MSEISAIIISCVEIIKKEFKEYKIEIISKTMFRTKPDNFNPIGQIGVKIQIDDKIAFFTL